MYTSNTIALLPAFLPGYFEEQAAINSSAKEKEMLDVATVLLRNSIQTVSVLETHEYRKLDCLVGNFGCQVIAAVIAALPKALLQEECTQLKTSLNTQLEVVKLQATLNGNRRKAKYKEIPALIKDLLAIKVSSEFDMVAKMHLLTHTKYIRVNPETGYETHQTISNRLAKLHKAVPQNLLDRMTKVSKTSLSRSSFLYFRAEVYKLLNSTREDESLKTALSDRYIKQDKLGEYSKDYYSLYPTMQGAFALAEHHRYLIAIKQIVKKGNPYILLFYRYDTVNKSYCLIEDKEIIEGEPILVLEGLVKQGIQKQDLIDAYQKVGVREPSLKQLLGVVEGDPYPKMEGENFCDETINTKEISAEVAQAAAYFTIDHVYCSSLKEISSASSSKKEQ